MRQTVIAAVVGWAMLGLAGAAQAQLVAQDDVYGVPMGGDLVVEAPGVLDNDTYGGEPAADAGAVVELVLVDAAFGTFAGERNATDPVANHPLGDELARWAGLTRAALTSSSFVMNSCSVMTPGPAPRSSTTLLT